MSISEALKKYCDKCKWKKKCWRMCPAVLLALVEEQKGSEQ